MSRDARLYLVDIQDACRRIIDHRGEKTRESFFADPMAPDAVLWNLLIIGEAAKQVPDDVQAAHPTVEWRKIAGFRDVLAHGYFGLDENIVWDVIESKIPPLLEAIERALASRG